MNIHFLNLITQKEIGVFPYSSSDYIGIPGVYWVPDGGRVAIIEEGVGDRPGTVHIWDVIENREICSFVEPAPQSQTFGGVGNGEWDFRWSPDGEQFLVWGKNGILYVVDAQTGAQISSYRKHYDEHINEDSLLGVPINCVAWSPNGKFIATKTGVPVDPSKGRDDNSVHVWSVLDGTQQCVNQGGSGLGLALGGGAVAWSVDSSMLVTAGKYPPAYIWDAMSGAPIFTSSADDRTPFLAWSPLGARIASGPSTHDTDVLFKVWNARDGKDVVEYKAHTDRGAGQLLWSPNGKLMAVMADSSLQIWEGGH